MAPNFYPPRIHLARRIATAAGRRTRAVAPHNAVYCVQPQPALTEAPTIRPQPIATIFLFQHGELYVNTKELYAISARLWIEATWMNKHCILRRTCGVDIDRQVGGCRVAGGGLQIVVDGRLAHLELILRHSYTPRAFEADSHCRLQLVLCRF